MNCWAEQRWSRWSFFFSNIFLRSYFNFFVKMKKKIWLSRFCNRVCCVRIYFNGVALIRNQLVCVFGCTLELKLKVKMKDGMCACKLEGTGWTGSCRITKLASGHLKRICLSDWKSAFRWSQKESKTQADLTVSLSLCPVLWNHDSKDKRRSPRLQ